MGRRIVYAVLYAVACPHCHAEPGRPCRRATGRYCRPHRARLDLVENVPAPALPVDCPGGCGRPVTNPNRPSCAYCWTRLPARLRHWLTTTKRHGPASTAYRRALVAVLAWYRHTPSPQPVGGVDA